MYIYNDNDDDNNCNKKTGWHLGRHRQPGQVISQRRELLLLVHGADVLKQLHLRKRSVY